MALAGYGLGGGVGGVDQHHAGDVAGVAVGVGEDVEAAEGVTGQHVGPGDVGALQQGVQVGCDLGGVLGAVCGLAPAATRTVVDADPGVGGYGGGYPRP